MALLSINDMVYNEKSGRKQGVFVLDGVLYTASYDVQMNGRTEDKIFTIDARRDEISSRLGPMEGKDSEDKAPRDLSGTWRESEAHSKYGVVVAWVGDKEEVHVDIAVGQVWSRSHYSDFTFGGQSSFAVFKECMTEKYMLIPEGGHVAASWRGVSLFDKGDLEKILNENFELRK